MARYSWLLLDADGTLLDFDRAMDRALELTVHELGATLDVAARSEYNRINARAWARLERGELDRLALGRTRFAEFFEYLSVEADHEATSHRYLEHLSGGADWLPGAERVTRALAQHARIAVMTNGFSMVQRPRLRASGLEEIADELIISEEVGAAKPDAKIFDAAFDLMGNPPKDRVMIVGDSLSADIAGGLGYGIDACWFNPARLANPDALACTFEIDDLEELRSIVDIG